MIFLHCVWKPWSFPPLAAFSQQGQSDSTGRRQGTPLGHPLCHWVLIRAAIRKTLQCSSAPRQHMWLGKDKYKLPLKVLELITISHTAATESNGQWVNKGNHDQTKEYFSWARTLLAAFHTQTHTHQDLLLKFLHERICAGSESLPCLRSLPASPDWARFSCRLAGLDHQEPPRWLQLHEA